MHSLDFSTEPTRINELHDVKGDKLYEFGH